MLGALGAGVEVVALGVGAAEPRLVGLNAGLAEIADCVRQEVLRAGRSAATEFLAHFKIELRTDRQAQRGTTRSWCLALVALWVYSCRLARRATYLAIASLLVV